MKIIIEQIEKDFYIDVVLSPKDYDKLSEGLMIGSEKSQDHVNYYVGVQVEE